MESYGREIGVDGVFHTGRSALFYHGKSVNECGIVSDGLQTLHTRVGEAASKTQCEAARKTQCPFRVMGTPRTLANMDSAADRATLPIHKMKQTTSKRNRHVFN